MSKIPRHPLHISGLAPDCRRVLVDAFATIQVAADRDRLIDDDGSHWVEERNLPGGGHYQANVSPRKRTNAEIQEEVAAAVVAYREIAEMWGVAL